MRSDGNRDKNITVRSAVCARISFAAERNRLPVVDTCGDIDGELLRYSLLARSSALLAGGLDNFSRSVVPDYLLLC